MEVDHEVAILIELKQKYKEITGEDVPSSGGKKEKKKEGMKMDTKTGIELKYIFVHIHEDCLINMLKHV